jgi:hypothetical protein
VERRGIEMIFGFCFGFGFTGGEVSARVSRNFGFVLSSFIGSLMIECDLENASFVC